MIEYFADENIAIGFWEEKARVHYKNYFVDFTYDASTDFGDIIYSIQIDGVENQIYTYGRSLIFFGKSYLIIEKVDKGQTGPITTSILDLSSNKMISLDGWYDKILIDENVVCNTTYDETKKYIIDDIESANWIGLK